MHDATTATQARAACLKGHVWDAHTGGGQGGSARAWWSQKSQNKSWSWFSTKKKAPVFVFFCFLFSNENRDERAPAPKSPPRLRCKNLSKDLAWPCAASGIVTARGAKESARQGVSFFPDERITENVRCALALCDERLSSTAIWVNGDRSDQPSTGPRSLSSVIKPVKNVDE